jgi:Mg-chelatase subunit ChlD
VRVRALLAAGLLAAALPSAAADPEPTLARASLVTPGEVQTRGLVFFLRVPFGVGVAAVASETLFDRSELAAATRIEFHAGAQGKLLASSLALLTPPGWPAATGARPASPHLVFALDARPARVTALEATADASPETGARVRVLGLAADGTATEQRFGRIAHVAPERFEIELDRPGPLRGWAGAPVLGAAKGELLGTLAAEPPGAYSGAVPVRVLAAALAQPLEHGAGRPFARFGAAASAAPPAGAKLIRPAEEQPTRVVLDVDVPADASAVPPSVCGIFVAGQARALAGGLRGFDVAIVIDTSLSTVEPTGADVNGNGRIGKPSLGPVGSLFDASGDDPGDSILAAEVAAARRLLAELDPRSARVALVTFAGELEPAPARFFSRGPKPPAVTHEPLTRDFARIERALDELLTHAPEGVTHMAAGVDQATLELLGQPGARSTPDPRSEKVMLFLTDGQPTLPFGPGRDAENVRAVFEAAERAREGGIRVHAFAIGPEALAGPIATVELAARTRGYFIPVREAGDLVDVVGAVDFPDLQDVAVRSATTGALAQRLRVDADGRFSGLVAAQPGENRIEIVARADDGAVARREIRVRLEPGAPPLVLPSELAAPRQALLEDCLSDLRDERRAAELAQAERVRRELLVEIEREREQARARAAEQRKQLRLELEPE